ncbi:MFS general substrate transporter [Mycena alexandri]|uniref:MFS general substrate transporter n=1 Tax=Mycena alexandri TaxID=1745969 RepID=A0AAD6WVV2_9AGAR|nr:MFS general substrate transporter [Mycena alexandri]
MYPPKNERDTLPPSAQGSEEGPSRMSQTKDELIVTPDVMEVPDGGAKAWLTVVGAWFVLFSTFGLCSFKTGPFCVANWTRAKTGYLYSYGVYQDFYTREYLPNHSPSSISRKGSFQIMMPFLVGVVSGKLFDNGHFHLVEISGGLIFVFSVFMLSLAKPHQYYQIFLSQGVGMGLGLGLTFVPTVSINVHHFKRRRGLAAGIGLSGSSVGATVFPIMINHLLPKIGFASTVRATGYIVLGCLILGNSMMRTRLPPRSQRPGAVEPPPITTFFKDAAYMWAVLGALISTLGFYFPIIYLQLFAVQHSVDGNLAFYSIAILNGASAFGRVIGNHFADVYGPYNIQVPTGLMTGATIFAVLGVHNGASLIVVSILYGLLSGAWLSLAFSILAALARSHDEVGARIGLALALSSFGSLGSAPIQGALLTDKFLWTRPIVFSGAAMFVGCACFSVTRTMQAKRLGTQKV